jgi:hypothetical protein
MTRAKEKTFSPPTHRITPTILEQGIEDAGLKVAWCLVCPLGHGRLRGVHGTLDAAPAIPMLATCKTCGRLMVHDRAMG